MSSYHTRSLKNANIFTIMGSIYAEVARYDTAVGAGQYELADQAAYRAQELIEFTKDLKQINSAQKQEIKQLSEIFAEKVEHHQKSLLDRYFMPFAIGARMRQFR